MKLIFVCHELKYTKESNLIGSVSYIKMVTRACKWVAAFAPPPESTQSRAGATNEAVWEAG